MSGAGARVSDPATHTDVPCCPTGSTGGLEVWVKQADGMSVVVARGRLLHDTATRLSRAVDRARAAGCEMIVIDLGGVSSLDTVALGVCMTSALAARSDGREVIVLPPAGDDDGFGPAASAA